ncbi:cytochrome P450 [Xylariaceae sp. AK1471]|nr:cytochrome P450 [Xylariaceae sp. AK1471]
MANEDPKSSVIAYAVTIIISSFVLYASYLILLHPLHSYPGPLLAKLTDFYAGFHAIKKNLHLAIQENHAKYGSVVRLAPNRLVFNTIAALHDIYQNDRVSKSHTYGAAVRNNMDNIFSARDKNIHRPKRRMVGAALTERATRSFEPTLIEQVDVYLKQLLETSKHSNPINYTERAKWLALDIVGKLSFGYHLGAQTREENRFVSEALAFGAYRGNIWHQLFFTSKIYFDKVFDTLLFGIRERYFGLLEKMIQSRIAQGMDGGRDFYSFISEMNQEIGSDVRKGELWVEANLLIVAGSDTTSAALSAASFYLSRNPECYQKLASEIRSTFGSGQDIKSGPQLASCRYLRACIDEAMRMSPPVSTILWREQDPNDEQPLVIDGHVIPKGTLFGVSAYAIHHNEEYFPDAYSFKPERWLDADTSPEQQAAAKRMHNAFAVFSIGSRSCAGKPLAYMEMSLVLAKTLWYFDFEAASGKLGEVGAGKPGGPPGRNRPGEFQLDDIFTSRHDGPYLIFRPRGELYRDLEAAA